MENLDEKMSSFPQCPSKSFILAEGIAAAYWYNPKYFLRMKAKTDDNY